MPASRPLPIPAGLRRVGASPDTNSSTSSQPGRIPYWREAEQPESRGERGGCQQPSQGGVLRVVQHLPASAPPTRALRGPAARFPPLGPGPARAEARRLAVALSSSLQRASRARLGLCLPAGVGAPPPQLLAKPRTRPGAPRPALDSALGPLPTPARRQRVGAPLLHLVCSGRRTHRALASLAWPPARGFCSLAPRCEWDPSSQVQMVRFRGTRKALCALPWRLMSVAGGRAERVLSSAGAQCQHLLPLQGDSRRSPGCIAFCLGTGAG